MRRRVAVAFSVLSLVAAGATPASPQEAGPPIVYSAYRYSGRSVGSAIFTIVPGEERTRLTGSRSFNVEPVWSPDHSRIAYVHHGRPRNPDIWVMNADGTNKVRLTTGPRDDVFPQWSPDGSHLAWVKAGPNGRTSQVWVMHPDGADKMAVSPEEHRAYAPAWSPDGHYVAYVHRRLCNDCRNDAEIFVVDGHASGTEPGRLTDNDLDDHSPQWSPDGFRIAFSREGSDGGNLFTMASDGSDQRQLTEAEGFVYLPSWSADGAEIAFTLVVDEVNFHTRLGVVETESGEERLLTDVETGGILPRWSADGDRIAFLGFHDGGYNLGVIGRDGTGAVQLTDSDGDEAWLDW